jgi:hypothetical protein
MPLGHLEVDTGVAWNSNDVRFTFRTRLHSAVLEGNITKAGALLFGFTAWVDASGALEDSVTTRGNLLSFCRASNISQCNSPPRAQVLSLELSGPSADAYGNAVRWVPCFLPSNATNRDERSNFEVADQCRPAAATTEAGIDIFAYGT